ncbi:DNA-binding transcriptional regulator, LysR family [Celeribacter baekdonensis]|jgi:DNA-binding transcriptional LysR family regulator|uniref:DNA-binding transcriptional regulator, LysR family n=2 Tax=Celeribacter baekdonensis TaxID=875171 RepID=A0A1G7NW78_9RHOB|nr:DNA-binding transcriptional regulator, LysR family [Celeribacter baekdonensis]
MHMHDRRIRFLYEAWRNGSMRAAADVLNVAPSSVSRQIAQLEEETGTDLIEHGRREIRLTDAGHAVLDYYRSQQASLEFLEGQLLDITSARAGHVEFAIGEGFLGQALYDTLDSFMKDYPRITLNVSVTDTTQMMRMILDDEVHFGVGFHPISHPQILSRYRATVPLMAIMHVGHPLAQRQSLSMAELCAEALALMGPTFRIRQMIDEAATNNGLMVAPIVTSNSIGLLSRMAIERRAMTVLPAFSVAAELARGELTAVSVDAPQLQSVYVHLLARRNRRFPPHLDALSDHIRKRLLPSTLSSPRE